MLLPPALEGCGNQRGGLHWWVGWDCALEKCWGGFSCSCERVGAAQGHGCQTPLWAGGLCVPVVLLGPQGQHRVWWRVLVS